MKIMKHAPQPVVYSLLEQMNRFMNRKAFAERLYEQVPVTAGLTNPGAAIPDVEGILYRGGAINLPLRLFHIGTLWGVSKIQKEVIPWNGEPTIRPVLPITLIFDHRLIDGVNASRLLLKFSEKIKDPTAYFPV